MEELGLEDGPFVGPDPKDKVTYKTKAERVKAIGGPIKDTIVDYLCKNAETLYIPKQINNDGDWLKWHAEKGQPLSSYHSKTPVIRWLSPTFNTIILYILDDGIPDDLIKALKIYCDAFFTNCKIEIKKPGDEWDTGKKLPIDFFIENKIKMRDDSTDPDRQAYTEDILSKLLQYKKKDTYAILGVTMLDLYPGIKWSYVFGWANFGRGTGVFSFKRYHPYFTSENTYADYVRLACHTMAHEIGHMFALHHCPYYECLMNGYNSMDE